MNKETIAKLPVLQLDADLAGRGNLTHMSNKAEKYTKVKEWLETPVSERMSIVLFRRTNKITRPMFEELKRNYLSNKDELCRQRAKEASRYIENALDVIDKPVGSRLDLEDDPANFWKIHRKELNQAIYESAVIMKNPQSQKLAKQLAGELVEKQEIKIGLTAEERARRLFQAQEELKKEGYIDSCGKR